MVLDDIGDAVQRGTLEHEAVVLPVAETHGGRDAGHVPIPPVPVQKPEALPPLA